MASLNVFGAAALILKQNAIFVYLYALLQFHLRSNTIQPPLLKDLQLNKNT